MRNEYVYVEDDYAYIDEPMLNDYGDITGYRRKYLFSKELFIECYNKWIKEQKK